MNPGLTFLSVKGSSLAAEARIIRRKEAAARRAKQPELRDQLRRHRKDVVGREARATHIAMGIIKGRDYTVIEPTVLNAFYNWPKVKEMVKRYGKGDMVEGIDAQMIAASVLVHQNSAKAEGRHQRKLADRKERLAAKQAVA